MQLQKESIFSRFWRNIQGIRNKKKWKQMRMDTLLKLALKPEAIQCNN